MRVMFFRLILTYMVCSFITLLMFLTGRLKIGSPKLRKKQIDNSWIIALFSFYWPLTMYMVYKTIKNGYRNKEE